MNCCSLPRSAPPVASLVVHFRLVCSFPPSSCEWKLLPRHLFASLLSLKGKLFVSHFSSFQCKIFYMWHVIFHVTWYSYNLRACIIFDLLMKILLNDFLEFAAENEIGLSWAWRVGMGIILAMVSKKIKKIKNKRIYKFEKFEPFKPWALQLLLYIFALQLEDLESLSSLPFLMELLSANRV